VTNVDARNPIRHWLEDVLDWHLIYRTGADMAALRPKTVPPDAARVYSEATGLNLFLEIRKPRA
jgi:extracellular factor (EF) 3-hydroxypalmitic acid methyl ester biosynthesis protein